MGPFALHGMSLLLSHSAMYTLQIRFMWSYKLCLGLLGLLGLNAWMEGVGYGGMDGARGHF